MRRRSYVKLLGLHRTAGSTWIAGIDTVSDSARGDCYSHLRQKQWQALRIMMMIFKTAFCLPQEPQIDASTRTIVIIRKGIDSNLSCVTVLHRNNIFSLNFISQYLHIFVNEETFSFGAWWIQKRRKGLEPLHCIAFSREWQRNVHVPNCVLHVQYDHNH